MISLDLQFLARRIAYVEIGQFESLPRHESTLIMPGAVTKMNSISRSRFSVSLLPHSAVYVDQDCLLMACKPLNTRRVRHAHPVIEAEGRVEDALRCHYAWLSMDLADRRWC